jgi:hypothetical protein
VCVCVCVRVCVCSLCECFCLPFTQNTHHPDPLLVIWLRRVREHHIRASTASLVAFQDKILYVLSQPCGKKKCESITYAPVRQASSLSKTRYPLRPESTMRKETYYRRKETYYRRKETYYRRKETYYRGKET